MTSLQHLTMAALKAEIIAVDKKRRDNIRRIEQLVTLVSQQRQDAVANDVDPERAAQLNLQSDADEAQIRTLTQQCEQQWQRLQTIASAFLHLHIWKFDTIEGSISAIARASLTSPATQHVNNRPFWDNLVETFSNREVAKYLQTQDHNLQQYFIGLAYNVLALATPSDIPAFQDVLKIMGSLQLSQSITHSLETLCYDILHSKTITEHVKVSAYKRIEHLDVGAIRNWSSTWFDQGHQMSAWFEGRQTFLAAATPTFWYNILRALQAWKPSPTTTDYTNICYKICNFCRPMYNRPQLKVLQVHEYLRVFLEYGRDNGYDSCCSTVSLNTLMDHVVDINTMTENPHLSKPTIRVLLCILSLNPEAGQQIFEQYLPSICANARNPLAEQLVELLATRFSNMHNSGDVLNRALKRVLKVKAMYINMYINHSSPHTDNAHSPSHARILDFLLLMGARFQQRDMTLGQAAMMGSIQLVQSLLESGRDINEIGKKDQYHTALEAACLSGNPDLVDFLMDRGAHIVRAVTLMDALRSRNLDLIHMMDRPVTNEHFWYALDASDISLSRDTDASEEDKRAENNKVRITLLNALREKGGVFVRPPPPITQVSPWLFRPEHDTLLKAAGFVLKSDGLMPRTIYAQSRTRRMVYTSPDHI